METTDQQQQQPAAEQLSPEQQEAQRQAADMQRQLGRQMTKGVVTEAVKSSARREVNRVISQMLPDEVNRLRWSGLKAIPIIGDIVDWGDRIFQLKRLFGKTKE